MWILNIGLSVVVFWYCSRGLNWLGPAIYTMILLVLVIAWAALLALTFGVMGSVTAQGLVWLLPLTVAFFGGWRVEAMAAALILLAALLSARVRIAQDVNNRIKYKTRYVFGRGVRFIILGSLVTIAGLALPRISDGFKVDAFITGDTIRPFLVVLQPLFSSLGGNYSASSTIGQMIEKQLSNQDGNELMSGQVREEQKRTVVAALSRQFGQEVRLDDDLAAVVARTLNAKIHYFLNANPLIATVVIMVLIVLFIRFLLPILVGPVLAVIVLLLFFGRRMEFIYIYQAEATVDKLTL